ncbi:MAG: DUF255 domain-containing protein [Bacteroidia bacterium]|nr:DUF255 domain-containing protein [Bacteroidia bacterium]
MMKKLLLLTFLLLIFFPFTHLQAQTPDGAKEKIEWMTFEEAMVRNQDGKKKIFIDIYTDWCGWCKKMDQSTFTDPGIIAEMNRNYLAVKLNAQQKGDITVGETVYKYEQRGSAGYHQLAVTLLDSKLKFPTCVILDERFNMLQPLPGYYNAPDLKPILSYLGDNMHQKMEFEPYKAQLNRPTSN